MSRTPGHGNHWGCVYPSVIDFFRDHFQAVLSRQVVHRKVPLPKTITLKSVVAETATAFAEAEGDLRHVILVGGNPAQRMTEMVSAYPLAAGGTVCELEIDEVVAWENGFEGQVAASTPVGASLGFFDPYFFETGRLYAEGVHMRFALSGFCYDACPAREDEMTVPVTKANRDLWVMQGAPADNLLHVNLRGMAILMPLPNWDIDDFSFRAPVVAVESAAVPPPMPPVWRLRVTLIRFEDEEIEVPIYVSSKVWKGDHPPRPGEDIEGSLWLQGYRVP